MATISFQGKRTVYSEHLRTPIYQLQHNSTISKTTKVDFKKDNIVIHGNNLYALKALCTHLSESVDIIYIDPPYNTGNEGWVYNDNVNSPEVKNWIGKTVGAAANDVCRHDKWLCTMWPRLNLAKQLLSNKGLIFISIDDNEQANLKLICDEIFGEQNFVANLIWKKKDAPGNTETRIGVITEYILVYAKNVSNAEFLKRQVDKPASTYSDQNGIYFLEGILKTDEGEYKRETMKYPINLNGIEYLPPAGKRWTIGQDTALDLISKSELITSKDRNGNVSIKRKHYTETPGRTTVPFNNLITDKGSLKSAKSQLVALGFNREDFSTPKPTELIEYLLTMVDTKDATVLDFFSGSGSTAQAVIEANFTDNGNRRYILVEQEDYVRTLIPKRLDALHPGLPYSFLDVTPPVCGASILAGNLPSIDELANQLRSNTFLCADAGFTAPIHDDLIATKDGAYLFARYKDDIDWLTSMDSALTDSYIAEIRKVMPVGTLIVYASACYISDADLRDMDVVFLRLPLDIK